MKKLLKAMGLVFLSCMLALTVQSQSMHIGEVLIVNHVALKEGVNPEAFRSYFYKEVIPSWNKHAAGNGIYLFNADRGDRKGSYLLVCSSKQSSDREKLPAGSPFVDRNLSGKEANSVTISNFVTNSDAYTEYHLIGPKQFVTQPVAGLLGIHFIKVKKDSAAAFEKFVINKLNPTVGHLLPDLQLMYFKATSGNMAGTYLTIFVLKSAAARDKYWPAGAPETQALKDAFLPYKSLAAELGSYLVKDSYLKPESGGAAAYFESLEWTDYIE
jgi:hypothetical protein